MRSHHLVRSLGLLLVLLWAPACARTGLPGGVREALMGASEIELYSLDPEIGEEGEAGRRKGAKTFHGWKVLGRTTLREKADRDRVVEAFFDGIREGGNQRHCFWPRHGVRAEHGGRTVELVICFQCRWLEVYVDGALRRRDVLTSATPTAAFNQALKEAGVPLPKQPN